MSGLAVTNLCKEYATRSEPLSILKDVSLDMQPGDNAAIVGPSGSGKSTLLHVIGTLEWPTSGTVRIGEQDPFSLSETALAQFRNEQIGYIFQDHHLLPQINVLENVLLPVLANQPKPDRETVERGKELLARVGLSERATHRPAELSGGERERTAVARALIRRPQLLLADEPTGNLDRVNANRVAKLLLELQQEEQTMLIVVTHSVDLARQLQRQYELNDGRLESLAR